MRKRSLRGQQQAEDIGLILALVFIESDPLQGSESVYSGVVKQNVDLSESSPVFVVSNLYRIDVPGLHRTIQLSMKCRASSLRREHSFRLITSFASIGRSPPLRIGKHYAIREAAEFQSE